MFDIDLPRIAAGLSMCLCMLALHGAPAAASEPIVAPLWPGVPPNSLGSADADVPTISVYPATTPDPHAPAIVVCPGGGYHALMLTYEGHDLVRWLRPHGFAVVVLKYRLQPYPTTVSIADGQRAIRLVRSRAKEWRIDPHRIGMMGFSAGGHLASSVGTAFDAGIPGDPDPVERAGCRPDFLVLVYPSTTIGGGRPTDACVTRRTPPSFLVHAATDQVVPVEESRRFHNALTRAGVASGYLELPHGLHGLGCGKGELWKQWQDGCIAWLRERGLAKP